jgi:excisionase family DNA binding protein
LEVPVNGEYKITSGHRERPALVYLRQSSLVQVRENTESTMRQYALGDKAVELGWAAADVEVIDADLGLSGTSTLHREGYRCLVSRVCLGEVGAVFGLEVSRLARSQADLTKLWEICRITDTLLIDADGIYDLGDHNDLLLLGLKSTMSEAELHVMAGRLQASKRAAAERGELHTPLPVGLVYDADGGTVIDPDAEVAGAVADVFAFFTATGSAYGVVQAFKDRRFPLRAYGGAWAGQLRWGKLTHARVIGVLKNPAYAGGYVYGRRASRKSVDPHGRVHSRVVELPREQWPVVIKNHHEGYVSWEDYLANTAKLAANCTNSGQRPPREGLALCQGIIGCGSCGQPMGTRYHTAQQPAYECLAKRDHRSTPTCRSVCAITVDAAVTEALLAALTPAQVTLALAAADQVADRHARAVRAAERCRERAGYESDRAERAFHAAEPENRLVTRTLETRWEAKLTVLAEAEHALATARDTLPPLPDRAALHALAAGVPALWHAESTSDKDRKRLLRTLIADVTLLPEPDRSKARIGIGWHTGATDVITIDRPAHTGTAARTPAPAAELIRRLGPTTSNADLVDILTRRSDRTGTGRPFDINAVQWVRHLHRIPTPSPYHRGELSVKQAADRLGCSTGVIYHWIETGQLPVRRGSGNRLCIPWNRTT